MFLAAAALLWLLVVPVQAASVPDSVTDALPPEAAARLEGLDEGTDHTAWSEGLSRLWQEARQYLGDALREKASGAALLLGVVLLCSVAESFFAAAEQPAVPQFVPMAGALAITLVAAGDFKRMMGLGVETMEELPRRCCPRCRRRWRPAAVSPPPAPSRWPRCISLTCC